MKRFTILRSSARRRAHAPQGFLNGDFAMSWLVRTAVNVAAFLFLAGVGMGVLMMIAMTFGSH
uniref:hypothetical protein n=1 Tax=Aminobacter niigataensis TaxID=83265 RepID=UPI002852A1E1|nr:hypothetical protein [Aminobacter niigataensis]WMD00537.1 hypothetical protein RAR13_29585 [Aminobacter niigataensis]